MFCPDDGTELKRVNDPYLGRVIAGRYRLVRRLGAGGMSSVYLANHAMIERLSALKILRSDLSRHPTHRERFLREARAVNRVNHPNIVEISDLGEADGVVYLVMEYVDGPSLHQVITRNKGPLEWRRSVRIALQIAAALARAHQTGIIHRDLKPENVLLASRPREPASLTPYPAVDHAEEDLAKLTDFGIAKLLDEPAITVGAQLFGTPGYIAPEYLEGAVASPRSDLYSLGVILYEMTTGLLPYDVRGAALLAAPLREPPIAPGKRVPGYPPLLEELLLSLLAREVDRRPSDAFAVYDALEQLLPVASDAADAPLLSTTPDVTRISYASQLAVRQDAHTVVVTPSALPSTPRAAAETADLTGPPSAVVRWNEALSSLAAAVERLGAGSPSDPRVGRAMELVTLAQTKVANLERGSRAAAVQQVLVDALEREARRCRADIGKAIDQLVLDRSRERAHVNAASERLRALRDVEGTLPDAVVWESAALSEETGESLVAEADLSFQIEQLERRLTEKNEALERELLEASGALEGSLTAARHLDHEIERLATEARALVSPPGEDGLPVTHRPAAAAEHRPG